MFKTNIALVLQDQYKGTLNTTLQVNIFVDFDLLFLFLDFLVQIKHFGLIGQFVINPLKKKSHNFYQDPKGKQVKL